MKPLKEWILPREIDFFKLMSDQSSETTTIVKDLAAFYTQDSAQTTEQIISFLQVTLFRFNDFFFLMHKEILSQLKEISKRIHVCANQLEDIIFKLT
jgi:hypothetical protein